MMEEKRIDPIMEDKKVKRKSLKGLRKSVSRFPRNLSVSSFLSTKSDNSSVVDNLNSVPHRSFSVKEDRELLKHVLADSYTVGGISYGVAQAVGRKDQDRYDVRLSNDRDGNTCSYFGVFDGHGTSALAADVCVDRLYDDIGSEIRKSPSPSSDMSDDEGSAFSDEMGSSTSTGIHHEPYSLPDDETIMNGFLKVDNEVRTHRHVEPRSGTCAVALFLDQFDVGHNLPNGVINGKVAWLGDCRAVMIRQDGTVCDLTLDHRIDGNENEHRRILEADHTPRDGIESSDIFLREVEKAKANGTRVRAHSFVAQREVKGKSVGANCVFAHSGGVSLQITRSIGDAYAARSVICTPEITKFSIPMGEYARIVLASDGVFDAMDNYDVAKFVTNVKSPLKAAKKLAAIAKQKRLYAGMSMDDITVTIVDVNSHKRKEQAKTSSKKHVQLHL